MLWTLALMMAATGCKADPSGGFGGGGTPGNGDPGSGGGSTGGDGSDDTGGSDTGGSDTGGSDTGGSDTGGGDTGGGDTGSIPCEEYGTDWNMTVGLNNGNLVENMGDDAGWTLWAHCGRPISIMIGNLYDAAYLNSLDGLALVKETHSDLLTIALLGYDASELIADQEDANQVQSTYGLDVVFYDPTLTVFNAWAQFAPPKTYLVDEALVIQWVNQGYADPVQIIDKISSF
jgi:hypothetical protein